jgi:hypothetical protein
MLSYQTSLATGVRSFGITLEPRYIVGTEWLDQ